MKKTFYLSGLFLGFVMCIMTLSSCGEDDLPEVLESEIIDTGIDKDVSVKQVKMKNGTVGTKLTYKSWIKVNSVTRATHSDVVSVTLNDVFHNVDTICYVEPWGLSNGYATDISYREKGTHKDGFVTTIDSAMVYTVTFDEFSFEYELEYQVAVYDDGVTKETMPYYKITNIRDNGYKVEDLDYSIEKNFRLDDITSVYLRKSLSHSITVELNGKDYKLDANVMLKRVLGTHPCVVASELLDSGISDIESSDWVTYYKSWIKLKHYYSDKTSATKTHETMLMGKLDYEPNSWKVLENVDISFLKAEKELMEQEDVYWNDDVQTVDWIYNFALEYNLFTLPYKLHEQHAYFDNIVARFDLPCLQYGEVKEEHDVKLIGTYSEGEDRQYDKYVFHGLTKIKFGKEWQTTDDAFQIFVYR